MRFGMVAAAAVAMVVSAPAVAAPVITFDEGTYSYGTTAEPGARGALSAGGVTLTALGKPSLDVVNGRVIVPQGASPLYFTFGTSGYLSQIIYSSRSDLTLNYYQAGVSYLLSAGVDRIGSYPIDRRPGLYSYAAQLSSADGSAFSIDQIMVAGVPEPATWALMILGFGAVGSAMRRSRVTAKAQTA